MGLVFGSKGAVVAVVDRDVAVAVSGREVSRAAVSQAATIRRRVAERTSGQIRDLAVAVEGRGIVLSGRSTTFYSKQLAQVAALPLAGELPLVNEIEVA